MLSFVVGLLTVLLVLDCLFLILLVLLQLPKKEAGAGVAFGGAATDALFGAGTGNVLTKVTKYTAAAFFVMALLLSILSTPKKTGNAFQAELSKKGAVPMTAPATNSVVPPAQPTTAPATTNK